MYAVQADGTSVVTVEGLAERCPVNGEAVRSGKATLSVLQQAFHEHHALQCGFCTAGLLTTASALLEETPEPTPEVVEEEPLQTPEPLPPSLGELPEPPPTPEPTPAPEGAATPE